MEYIYTITNKENNRIYVGKTSRLESRRQTHLANLRANKHSNKELQEDFNKYGESLFEFNVVQQGEGLTEEEAEKKWMIKLKSYDPKYGYNSNDTFFRTRKGNKTKLMKDIESGIPVDIKPKAKKKKKVEEKKEIPKTYTVTKKDLEKFAEAIKFATIFESLTEEKKNYIMGYMACLADMEEQRKVNNNKGG